MPWAKRLYEKLHLIKYTEISKLRKSFGKVQWKIASIQHIMEYKM